MRSHGELGPWGESERFEPLGSNSPWPTRSCVHCEGRLRPSLAETAAEHFLPGSFVRRPPGLPSGSWSIAMISGFRSSFLIGAETLRRSFPMMSGAATIDQITNCVVASSSVTQSLPASNMSCAESIRDAEEP